MSEKTLIEKAAEKVGFGLAMAEDAAGSVKAAVDAAVSKYTESPKRTTSPAKKDGKQSVAQPVAKKAVAKKAVAKKKATKKAVKTATSKHSTGKKTGRTKAAKKAVKASAKKVSARR